MEVEAEKAGMDMLELLEEVDAIGEVILDV